MSIKEPLDSDDEPRPVSLKLLFLVVGGTFIAMFFLIPTNYVMVDRLERDGELKRAMEILQELPKTPLERFELRFLLRELRLRRKLTSFEDQETVEPLFREITQAYQNLGHDSALLQEFILTLRMLEDPLKAWDGLRSLTPFIPVESLKTAYDAFAETALAREEPVLAADIYVKLFEFNIWEIDAVKRSIQYYRMAGKPKEATMILTKFEDTIKEPLVFVHPELTLEKVALLRESENPAGAFSVLFDTLVEHRKLPPVDGDVQDEVHRLLIKTALESSSESKLLNYYLWYSETFPDETLVWIRLGEVYLALHQYKKATGIYRKLLEEDPENRVYKKRLAEAYEWGDESSMAFDLYLELVDRNNLNILDRLLNLYEGLYRIPIMAEVLQSMVPISGKPDYTLDYARVATKLGDYEAGKSTFKSFLEKDATDAGILFEYGNLLYELQEFEEAQRLYESAHLLNASNDLILLGIAKCLYMQNRYDESYELYKELVRVRQTTDHSIIQSYAYFSVSLGYYENYAEGMKLYVLGKENPTAFDFLSWARAYELLKDFEQAEIAARAGLEAFPNYPQLIFVLALNLSEQDKFQEAAMTIVQHTQIRNRLEVLVVYLDIMLAAQEYQQALEFLSQGYEDSLKDSTEIRQRIADFHFYLEEFDLSRIIYQKLYREHPSNPKYVLNVAGFLAREGKLEEARSLIAQIMKTPTPFTLKMGAQVTVNSGMFAAAERFHLRYLTTQTKPTYQELGFLGDIRMELGDRKQARRDYVKALDRMIETVRGDSDELLKRM